MHRLSLIVIALAGLLTTGCVKFPYHASFDRHNFLSTPHMPMSLALVDTLTGETVWTLDIPVNQMAVVDLEHKADWTPGQSPAMPAYKISWDLFEPTGKVGLLRNEQPLSGNPVLLKVAIREKGDPGTTPVAALNTATTPVGSSGRDPRSEYPVNNQPLTNPRTAPATAPAAAPGATPNAPATGAPAAPARGGDNVDPALVPPKPQFQPAGTPAGQTPAARPANQPNPTPSQPAAPNAPTAPTTPNQPGKPGETPAKRPPLGADDTGKP